MTIEKELSEYRNISKQAKERGSGMIVSRLWLKVGVLECYRKGNNDAILLAAQLDDSDRFVRLVRNDEAINIIQANNVKAYAA